MRLRRAYRFLCLATALALAEGVALLVLLPAIVRSVPFLAKAWSRPCVFKAAFGVPCPLCGVTRSLALLAQGRWADSLSMNPLGLMTVAGGAAVIGVFLACAVSGRDLGLVRMSRSKQHQAGAS